MSVLSRVTDANPRLERAVILLRAIVHEVRTERLTFMAGSIAYHAFVSLLPLLLLVLAVLAWIGDRSLEVAFEEFVASVLTPGASAIFVRELSAAGGSAGLSLFGGAVLVWGTLRIFRGLDTAFSSIYETEAENTFADQLSDGVVVLSVFALAILLAVLVESAALRRHHGTRLVLSPDRARPPPLPSRCSPCTTSSPTRTSASPRSCPGCSSPPSGWRRSRRSFSCTPG